MGLLRLLLALSVLVGHSWRIAGLSFITPSFAVSIFFTISGFYMALVLNEKYESSRRGTRLFWSNRLLRLFPTYLTVLVLTVAIYGASVAWGQATVSATFKANFPWLQSHTLGALTPASVLVFVFVNLFIIGQDITLFALIRPSGALSLSSHAIGSPDAAYKFLLVPQAWSISLELVFYSIAPFLLRRRVGVLFGLLAASVALRVALILISLDKDPWTYRFFPTALACFLLGAISFRLAERTRTWHLSRGVGLAGTCAAATLVAFNGSLASAIGFVVPHSVGVAQASALSVVVLLMPAIFEYTKSSRVDEFVGELSYPLYLLHLMVIQTLAIYAQIYGGFLKTVVRVGTPYVALVALALSAVIVFAVERPIDRWRQKRVRAYDERAAEEAYPRSPAEITA